MFGKFYKDIISLDLIRVNWRCVRLFYYGALCSILYTKDIIEHDLRYMYDAGTKRLNYSWALKDWTL